MKGIFSAVKYVFVNIIFYGFLTLPLALLLALKFNGAGYTDFLFRLSESENKTLMHYYSRFSLLPGFEIPSVINVFLIVSFIVLGVLTFSVAFAYMERHLKYGIKSVKKAFVNINHTFLTIFPAIFFLLIFEELIALIAALFANLFNVAGYSGVGLTMPFILIGMMVLSFYFLSMFAFYVPIRLFTGYTTRDSVRYSIRLASGSHTKTVLALFLPFFAVSVLTHAFALFCGVQTINMLVSVICYIFLLNYIPAYLMTKYMSLSGMERKDFIPKLF